MNLLDAMRLLECPVVYQGEVRTLVGVFSDHGEYQALLWLCEDSWDEAPLSEVVPG